jgi:hypothetical protein
VRASMPLVSTWRDRDAPACRSYRHHQCAAQTPKFTGMPDPLTIFA